MRSANKLGAKDRKRIAFTVVEEMPSGPASAVVIAVLTGTVLALFQAALWLVAPLILALVLYYLLRPVHFWLSQKGLPGGAAAGLVMSCFTVVSIGLVFGGAQHFGALALENDGVVARLRQSGPQLFNQLMAAGDSFVGQFLSVDTRDELKRHIPASLVNIARSAEPSVASMSKWLPPLFLIPFFAFYLLKEGRELKTLIARPIPNAFFEASLVVLDRVDDVAMAYFRGLFQLTILDTVMLSLGLTFMGLPYPILLGLASALLMWIPYIGGLVAGLCACIVAVTEFPGKPEILYGTLALYLVVRWLDGFVFMPMTIGKNLHIHPIVAILTILVSGAVAGIPGMMMALPVYGILKVAYEASSVIVLDARLRARYRHEKSLRRLRAESGLILKR